MKLKKKISLSACLPALFFVSYAVANPPNEKVRGTSLSKHAAVAATPIKGNPDDKKRWASTTFYSFAKKAEELEMNLITGANFKMILQPKLGHLVFARKNKQDVFEIRGAPERIDIFCPEYHLRVLDAESDYVLFSEVCPGHKYVLKGDKDYYFITANYYLYDSKTATVTRIWSNASNQPEMKTLEPEVKPKIQRFKNGYELDWHYINPLYEIIEDLHTRYLPTTVNGKPAMECTALDAKEGDTLQAVFCGYGDLLKVQK